MKQNINDQFFEWLKKQPGIGEPSAKSYSTPYFNRACKIWDESMTYLRPLNDSLSAMLGKSEYHNAIGQILLTLEDKILQKVRKGEISKRYGDNIRTAIHRFQEFSASSKTHIVSHSISSSLPLSENIVKEVAEDDYDIEILRKKFQARIASGQRREFPARILNSILKKVTSDSWIQKSIERLSILTEGGLHSLNGVDRFKVKDGILYIRPIVYRDSNLVTKGNAIIDSEGFVKVLGYHSDGSIHPFRVVVRTDGSIDFGSISIDHSPAISLVMSTGKYPEFDKVNKGQDCNPTNLLKEFEHINSITSYILMERGENSSKGNKW